MDGSSVRSEINLVLLTPGFADREMDTTTMPSLQLFVRSLLAEQPGIRIRIVSLQFPFTRGCYSWYGVPVYSAGGRNRKWNRHLTWIRVLNHLFALRRHGKTDLIHAFWLTEATLLAMLFRMITGTPVVTTAMGQDVKQSNKYLRLLKILKPETVLISEFQRSFLAHRKGIRIGKTIPFGVDPTHYAVLPADRPTDILAVGSLNRIKNYTEFLETVKVISEEFPAIRCRIIGEGSESDGIGLLIRTMGLEHNVTLAGNTSYAETQGEMCRGKILLHTSRFEGQGLVITEALAAGMHVVCHPAGTAFSLCSPNLLTGNTTAELIAHVRSLLLQPSPDHSSRIYIKITDTCREYVNLYRSLLLR
jgi:glycosyltransferase involved in cell wall biosynthesis